jgi:hypothetical protein
MSETAAQVLAQPGELRDIIRPQFHQLNFPAEHYIKNKLNLRLDKDDQICRLSLTPGGCPLGPLQCPFRHTEPSPLNFQPPKPQPSHPRERERLSTVCKHWLRGLCKKGDNCEFLHEYNLRRMPECWWYAKYGYCSAGDECLYAHPKERKIECPDYNRGFCKLGAQGFLSIPQIPETETAAFVKVLHVRASMCDGLRANCSLPGFVHRAQTAHADSTLDILVNLLLYNISLQPQA